MQARYDEAMWGRVVRCVAEGSGLCGVSNEKGSVVQDMFRQCVKMRKVCWLCCGLDGGCESKKWGAGGRELGTLTRDVGIVVDYTRRAWVEPA